MCSVTLRIAIIALLEPEITGMEEQVFSRVNITQCLLMQEV